MIAARLVLPELPQRASRRAAGRDESRGLLTLWWWVGGPRRQPVFSEVARASKHARTRMPNKWLFRCSGGCRRAHGRARDGLDRQLGDAGGASARFTGRPAGICRSTVGASSAGVIWISARRATRASASDAGCVDGMRPCRGGVVGAAPRPAHPRLRRRGPVAGRSRSRWPEPGSPRRCIRRARSDRSLLASSPHHLDERRLRGLVTISCDETDQ